MKPMVGSMGLLREKLRKNTRNDKLTDQAILMVEIYPVNALHFRDALNDLNEVGYNTW